MLWSLGRQTQQSRSYSFKICINWAFQAHKKIQIQNKKERKVARPNIAYFILSTLKKNHINTTTNCLHHNSKWKEIKFTAHLTNISLFKNITLCRWAPGSLFNEVTLDPAPEVGKLCELSIPGPLSVQCERSGKEAITGLVSRLNLGGDWSQVGDWSLHDWSVVHGSSSPPHQSL